MGKNSIIGRKGIIYFLLVFNLLLFLGFLSSFLIKNIFFKDTYSELSDLSGNESFLELKEYFTNLAEDKDAVYAYEVLKRAEVAPGIDMHLMGHVVGEILYKQKGADGMEFCTHDFRNACSHTIVVGLFSEKGVGALPEITEACKKAPGGRGAYNMCFHGLGHGVLAFTGYELPKAVGICSQIERGRTDGREFPECVGGTIMEIISGGDHDKQTWLPKHGEYMRTSDPLYPCNSNIIPSETKRMCYTYLTPNLFLHADADVGNPTEADFEKAFTYCEILPESDPNRRACYAGFGKEFVVLAASRDIRKVGEMTDEELALVYDWCSLSDVAHGETECLGAALSSLYWGGENNVNVSIKFCNIMHANEEKTTCFRQLISMVNYFISDRNYIRDFCQQIPQALQEECKV